MDSQQTLRGTPRRQWLQTGAAAAMAWAAAPLGALAQQARWLLPQVVVDALQYQAAPFENTAYEPLAGVIHLAAWRARGREAGLSERELAVSFPGEIGLMLGLDIDMVLQQDPIDWTVRPDAADYLV